MSWVGLLVLVIAVWLAFKAVGLFFRLALWVLVIALAWWLLAPHLGLPTPW